MTVESERSRQIQSLTRLRPEHFDSLIRLAQQAQSALTAPLINWTELGISPAVLANLKLLGRCFPQTPTPAPIALLWNQMTPETRSWFIDFHSLIYPVETAFSPSNEDEKGSEDT